MPQACSDSTTVLSLIYTETILRVKNLQCVVDPSAVGSRKVASWQLSRGEVNSYAAPVRNFC